MTLREKILDVIVRRVIRKQQVNLLELDRLAHCGCIGCIVMRNQFVGLVQREWYGPTFE